MKRIVYDRIYDTDTATLIGTWEVGLPSELAWNKEELYRKKNSEYFLYCASGPMGRCAQEVGNGSWKGGQKIIPVTFEKAKEWACEHMDADAWQAEFGPVTEGEGRAQLSISVSKAVEQSLRTEARERGMTVSALIEEIVQNRT